MAIFIMEIKDKKGQTIGYNKGILKSGWLYIEEADDWRKEC